MRTHTLKKHANELHYLFSWKSAKKLKYQTIIIKIQNLISNGGGSEYFNCFKHFYTLNYMKKYSFILPTFIHKMHYIKI